MRVQIRDQAPLRPSRRRSSFASAVIREEFENGRDDYALEGQGDNWQDDDGGKQQGSGRYQDAIGREP